MNSRVALFAVLTVAILSGGCGTIANTTGCAINPPCREFVLPEEIGNCGCPCCGPLWWDTKDYQNRVYGGVRDDWNIIYDMQYSLPHEAIDPFWAMIDMPFSAIGDTITFPYILAYQMGVFGGVKEQPAER
jgi:uncharacterized protein YceK